MKASLKNEVRQIFVALAASAVLVALGWGVWRWVNVAPPPLGSGVTLDAVAPSEDRSGERLIRLNDSIPGLILSAWPFEEEFTSPDTYRVEKGDGIEFIPLVTTPSMDPPEIEAFFRSEDRGETWLGKSRMASVPGLLNLPRADVLGASVTLDLTPLEGMIGRIVWRIASDDPPPAAIAGFHYVQRRDAARPSILMVCSDTHRYDYSLAGRGPALMPRLTALAGQSSVYTHAYSTASWTLPSIASVLTGRFPRHHLTGQRVKTGKASELDEDDIPPGNFAAVWGPVYHQFTTYPRALTSLPQALRDSGYTTVLIYANTFLSLSGLHADGFDAVFDATLCSGKALNIIARDALQALPPDKPVFMYVHYLDVHEFLRTFFIGSKIPGVRTDEIADAFLAPREAIIGDYEKAVALSDTFLGELMDSWDDRMKERENMVVFFSDHGEHLFDPGHSQAPVQNPPVEPERRFDLPILSHGNSMEEVLLHVPLLVRYPFGMKIPAGPVDRPVSLADLMPTILEIAGVKGEAGDSKTESLIPGERDDPGGDGRYLFADYQLYGDEHSSVRRAQFKLVLNLTATNDRTDAVPGRTLVDLSKPGDSGETSQAITNEVVDRELSDAFRSYAGEASISTQGLASDHRPDLDRTTKELQALGYIN